MSSQKTLIISLALSCAALISVSCASRNPAVRAEAKTESKISVRAAPRISMKPYHMSMRDEMQISFESADEIILGIYTGTFGDGDQGRLYYFDRFRTFDKATWTWGPEMNVLLPVLFQEVRPEIITSREFKSLSDLDKTGICWDDYEGPRVIYLVEGIPALLFLKQTFDEASRNLRRILIDTYPVTGECRAKDVFDLMLRDRAGK
jgi:hypothetical protein